MKKFLVALLIAVLIPVFAYGAAGTATLTSQRVSIEGVVVRKIITISWTGGTAGEAGTVPSTTITAATYDLTGWYLYSAETNPGTTPSADYDIVINDADGVDLAAGLLANRSASATQLVNIGTSAYGYPVVRGNLTFVLSNNTEASSTGTLVLVFIQ